MSPAEKKPVTFVNLFIGASLNLVEVSTLGQPFEVIKTHMAANRGDSMWKSIQKTYQRGGLSGYYQGLIPWAWIEAASKGAVLLFAASEVENRVKALGANSTVSGIVGGMGGGIAQAYTTMGICTFMKTVEVTRQKQAGVVAQSTMQVAKAIFMNEGIRGLNKGVNAVALRQTTNWGSRFGLSRLGEDIIRSNRKNVDPSAPLTPIQKILASTFGGALSCWNQPIEVIRVEMQSQIKSAGRPEKLTIGVAAKWIYKNHGVMGFYRGVTPRVCLGIWQTVCMVFGGDHVKAWAAREFK